MNKTKRKIFEVSLKLFAEKGYEATSIEEITATVGVAKGTLYYHFNSKQEIFKFLVDEGFKLIINSIKIKCDKCNNALDKLKAISLVQLKTVLKYEDLVTIILSQSWGNEAINVFCKERLMNYIDEIALIVDEAKKSSSIRDCDSLVLATEIVSLVCSTLLYRKKYSENELDIKKLYNEYERTFFERIENR